jgi:hypothetical protein
MVQVYVFAPFTSFHAGPALLILGVGRTRVRVFEGLILVLIFYFPLFALVCLAAVLARLRPALARTLYRLALLLSVLPYLLHVWYVWGWITEFGDPHPKIGVYPGLISYGVSALAAVCILLAAALLLVRRAPAATALLPPALWLVYWYVCLPRVYRNGAPEFAPLDNIPLVWPCGEPPSAQQGASADVRPQAFSWTGRYSIGRTPLSLIVRPPRNL